MGLLSGFSTIFKSGPPHTVNPRLKPAATLLDAIVDLSKKVPQNKFVQSRTVQIYPCLKSIAGMLLADCLIGVSTYTIP